MESRSATPNVPEHRGGRYVTKKVNNAWSFGYAASERGEPLASNPYEMGCVEHRLWTTGWISGGTPPGMRADFERRNAERRARAARLKLDPDIRAILDDMQRLWTEDEIERAYRRGDDLFEGLDE